MPINQTAFEDETGLKFITPFRFMTAQERANRQPGVTDDLPAFQAALDYLKSIVVNNDGNTYFGAPILYVPAGTYRWNGTLDVKDFTLQMRGEAQGKGGGAGTVIRLPADTVAFRIERANTTPAGTGAVRFPRTFRRWRSGWRAPMDCGWPASWRWPPWGRILSGHSRSSRESRPG